jgi:hypothetical protein
MNRIGPAPDRTVWAACPWTGDLGAAFLEAHAQLVAALAAEGQVAQAEALAGHLGWLPPAD